MGTGFFTLAYLVAGGLFILSLGGLSQQRTAVRGNLYGIVGMGIALLVTLIHPQAGAAAMALLAISVGGVIGMRMAHTVEMTAMPELVAILHSFVGLAAVLVGLSTYLEPSVPHTGAEHTFHTERFMARHMM